MIRTIRTIGVTAGSALLVTCLAGTASASEVVKAVWATANEAADDAGDAVTKVGVNGRSAVVGYIRIDWLTGSAPSYRLLGALADPGQWSCSGSAGAAAYTVTCLPQTLPVGVEYHCDVLHADVFATGAASSGRSSLDCDSDGVPEAATRHVVGPGADSKMAVDTRLVTAFTCTLDLAAPDVTGGCGDPGYVGPA